MRHNDYMDALRISEAERESIFRELERADLTHPDIANRHDERYPYFVREGLIFEIEGATTRFVVRPRDISGGGVSFLHGSFLHPGRACVMALKTIDGEHVLVTGRTVRCRCVRGRIHDVGMQFDKPVDVNNFVRPRTNGTPSAPPAEGTPAPAAYNGEELLLLLGGLQALVSSGAPREQLFQKLARIVAILRDGAAGTGPTPAGQPQAGSAPL